MFHKIMAVHALADYRLCVVFSEGLTIIYNIKPLFAKWPAFRALEDDIKLFYNVKVDKDGFGIVWNDNLDLSCNEIFEYGKRNCAPLNGHHPKNNKGGSRQSMPLPNH